MKNWPIAKKEGYVAFHKDKILGDDNPKDPYKREYNLWEDGWWIARTEFFGETVGDYVYDMNFPGPVPMKCLYKRGSNRAKVWHEAVKFAQGMNKWG